MDSHMLTDDFTRFFGAHSAALYSIHQTLKDANLVLIATAYFEASGYQVLQDTLAGKRIHLLIGRSEGGVDNVAQVLNEFEQELASGNMERRTRAMRLMLEALQLGLMTVGMGEQSFEQAAAMDARYLYHHAKLYICDEVAAVVTSANFSHHGMVNSREAGITVFYPEDVAFFVRRFDHYFSKAQKITQVLIDKLLAWLHEYDPYYIYAKALLELYGLPDENIPESLPPLALYQRAVVSSVLASLLDQRGAFLIASTGLGKTIIAAHTVAYLRMQDEIDSVLVACPAGLKEMWRRTMHAARTASEEFSYHTLSGKDRRRDSGVGILEHQLRYIDDKTLVILDESHHLRNEDDLSGDMRLRNQRIYRAAREKSARLLLMTATPYSKDKEDVNSQLRLLPPPLNEITNRLGIRTVAKNWKIDFLSELSDLPPCTVLTTPDVVQHFGAKDGHGARYVEFSPGDRRYFPRRLTLKTVQYQNPLDDMLVELLTSDLLYANPKLEQIPNKSMLLFAKEMFDDVLDQRGKRIPFYESQVLHQFCSSPARIKVLCKQLETGSVNFEFQNQKRLIEFIRAWRPKVERTARPKYDTKLNELIKIIQLAGDEKVTVFCQYIETAHRLKESLQKRLRRLKVETTAEMHSPELDLVLQLFAPVANEVPQEDRQPNDELQVLICTSALAEGFNLQDSRILVNYDLPWTILQLAQRMGRILRPWHTPRDVIIYNFIPSTMEHPKLRNARRWQSRLQERNEQHRSFSQIPVLIRKASGGKVEEGYEMEQLASKLYEQKETYLDLDEVLDFIQNADSLTTSTFYKDLANISKPQEITHLPAGIRSARLTKGKKQLFLLFRYGSRQYQAGLFDDKGKLTKDGDHREVAMRAIRCPVDEPKAPAHLYPDDDTFDMWIECARQNWAEAQGLSPHKLQIVCAMALIPEL
jgi:superfamily II DNA or RNA helicase